MSQPWHAEHEITLDLARELIDAQFPPLRPARVEPFAAGWDNTACLVNQRYVFRFPRRALGVRLMHVELRVLPEIPTLPVPISRPAFIGTPVPRFPYPFGGYERLEGTPLADAPLPRTQRRVLARQLGAFLAALHAVDLASLPCEIPGDELRKVDVAHRRPAAIENLARLRHAGLLSPTHVARLSAMLNELPSEWTGCAGSLVHGDVYSRHVLVNRSGALAGIIDWGDVHRGDPACDLSAAFLLLPGDSWGEFSAAYGRAIDERTRALARFRAMLHAGATAIFAADVHDAALLHESLDALGEIVVAKG